MAISNMDQFLAGLQPPVRFMKCGQTMQGASILTSTIYYDGVPGKASANGNALAGAALTSYTGALPFYNPGAGNSYLTNFEAWAGPRNGTLFLCDRLWHNDSISVTTTTGQTINSVTLPARDMNGSTNGARVLAALEVSSATGNGGAITNTTITYTNSGGTGSRTGTIPSTIPAGGFPASAKLGTFIPFTLAAGDVGVRSIQTLTLGTSYVSGTIHLVMYRILAVLPITSCGETSSQGAGQWADFVKNRFERLYDNTVPFVLWLPTATTAVQIHGSYGVTQG